MSRLKERLSARINSFASVLRSPQQTISVARSVANRLLQFWLVWSMLLFVHEGGHALSARNAGLEVRRVTVGFGPVLWQGSSDGTQIVLRLVPVAGITTVNQPHGHTAQTTNVDQWSDWLAHATVLASGVAATLVFAIAIAALVALLERIGRTRCLWGRIVVADALVLTVFNFLPVPPLDGGQALLGAFAAWNGAPLTADALMWVHVGGLALAVVPMLLWTSWTARIDRFALWWKAP